MCCYLTKARKYNNSAMRVGRGIGTYLLETCLLVTYCSGKEISLKCVCTHICSLGFNCALNAVDQ